MPSEPDEKNQKSRVSLPPGKDEIFGDIYEDRDVEALYDEGLMIVVCRPLIGQAGKDKSSVMSAVPADHFVRQLDGWKEMNRKDRLAILPSIRKAIKSALLKKTGKALAQDQDFLADLVLLCGALCLLGRSVTEGSGVGELGLLIHPDENRPRQYRGMLPEEAHAKFGIPEMAFVVTSSSLGKSSGQEISKSLPKSGRLQ